MKTILLIAGLVMLGSFTIVFTVSTVIGIMKERKNKKHEKKK